MATEALLTPKIRAQIGKRLVFSAPEELGIASIRKFALAIALTLLAVCTPEQINKLCATAAIERCRGSIVLDSDSP